MRNNIINWTKLLRKSGRELFDANEAVKTAANILLAMVGVTAIDSTLAVILVVCANVGPKFFRFPTIAST